MSEDLKTELILSCVGSSPGDSGFPLKAEKKGLEGAEFPPLSRLALSNFLCIVASSFSSAVVVITRAVTNDTIRTKREKCGSPGRHLTSSCKSCTQLRRPPTRLFSGSKDGTEQARRRLGHDVLLTWPIKISTLMRPKYDTVSPEVVRLRRKQQGNFASNCPMSLCLVRSAVPSAWGALMNTWRAYFFFLLSSFFFSPVQARKPGKHTHEVCRGLLFLPAPAQITSSDRRPVTPGECKDWN